MRIYSWRIWKRQTSKNAIYSNPTSGGVRLHAATLTEANLEGADLRAGTFSFGQRKGQGAVDMTRAVLDSARLHNAMLDGAKMGGASCVRTNFIGASMPEVDLSGADLKDANLSHAKLKNAVLSGPIWKAPI